MSGSAWEVDIDLGDVRLVTLGAEHADLLVEATGRESEPALWGPRPAGPYTLADAQAALAAWDPDAGRQVSVGAVLDGRLLGAGGVMVDTLSNAELAYWVRPEERGRGLATRLVRELTSWVHRRGGISRVWLEIDPANAASIRVAERSGYSVERRLAGHCRAWVHEDPAQDAWHDCDIWVSTPVT